MEEVLNVTDEVIFEERITNYEYHTHQSYTQFLNNSDEIIISVQQQDIFTVPSKSFLYIQGKVEKEETSASVNVRLVRNAFMFLFDEIKYQLNGVLVDHVRNPGIVSTLKGYVSFNSDKVKALEIAGWMPPNTEVKLIDDDGNFDCCIPLDTVMGFFEDYNRIILQGKHELILHRSRSDNDSIFTVGGAVKASIKLKSVQWRIPYVKVSDQQKLKFLNVINKGKTMHMAFRSWDLIEYPTLPATTKHTWALKTTTNLEKPRYVIIAFQTSRKDNKLADPSIFDQNNITNVKLHLNSEIYPYDDLNVNFSKNYFSFLYYMYQNFQHSYYGKANQPLMTKNHFKDYAPIIVIDCSRQSEAIRSSSVDIRLEIECTEAFKADTTAYALILHDSLVEYNPLSGIVRRI
uniref:Putative polinton-9 nvi n=1 Tax=Panstrongylus lignarius TaxID=156445 RepID=A0A224XPM0_9HEMI